MHLVYTRVYTRGIGKIVNKQRAYATVKLKYLKHLNAHSFLRKNENLLLKFLTFKKVVAYKCLNI